MFLPAGTYWLRLSAPDANYSGTWRNALSGPNGLSRRNNDGAEFVTAAKALRVAGQVGGGGGGCVDCEPGKTHENEPCNFNTGGLDFTNGGCNSTPPVFSPIQCGEAYCSEGYYDGSFRDTDWYEAFCLDETEMVWKGVSEFPVVLGLVDTGFIPDCALATALSPFAVCLPCEPCVVDPVVCPAGGTAWWFVGHDFSVITNCFDVDFVYNVELNCETAPCKPCPGDIDGNCSVGFSDLNTILANWGDCP